jgi:NADH:ubiquinone oxidoreductase subunit E
MDEKTQGNLISKLQDIQAGAGYITEDAIARISRLFNISKSKIYGVTTFYTQFRFTPAPGHCIKVCLGTACHVRGAEKVMEALENELGISCGGVASDNKFGLERVACFGCCALGPIIVIDGKVYSRTTPKKALLLLKKIK